jgi:hypothetical protein
MRTRACALLKRVRASRSNGSRFGDFAADSLARRRLRLKLLSLNGQTCGRTDQRAIRLGKALNAAERIREALDQVAKTPRRSAATIHAFRMKARAVADAASKGNRPSANTIAFQHFSLSDTLMLTPA